MRAALPFVALVLAAASCASPECERIASRLTECALEADAGPADDVRAGYDELCADLPEIVRGPLASCLEETSCASINAADDPLDPCTVRTTDDAP